MKAQIRNGITHHYVPRSNNQIMIERLVHANAAVSKLTIMGITVLEINIEDRRPVIWVQNSVRCTQLNGATMITRVGPVGREKVMVAPLDKCQVQWMVRGH